MKPHLFSLPLLALSPVVALAQPKPNAPQISIDPAAKALLNRATATYKAATGLRYDQQTFINGETLSHTRVTFAHPNRVRIDDLSSKPITPLWLLDGTNIYAVMGTRFQKLSAKSVSGVEFLDEHTFEGQFIGAMLSGKSVLDFMQESSEDPSVLTVRARLDFLKPQLVDGEIASGVRVRGTFSARAGASTVPESLEMTMWFDKSAMLRRVQGIVSDKDKPQIVRTRLWNQQLNPEFAPDTWKFNDAGLRLINAPKDAPRFDPRLTWGAVPPAFEAKSVDGQSISLQKYKGKVVLLDFWATWCGPCLTEMPKIQAAYDKYHAQGFEIIGVSLDRKKEDLTSFLKDKKMAWPQIYDGPDQKTRVSDLYAPKGIPFLVLIGRNGKIEAVNPRDDLDGAIKRALAAN